MTSCASFAIVPTSPSVYTCPRRAVRPPHSIAWREGTRERRIYSSSIASRRSFPGARWRRISSPDFHGETEEDHRDTVSLMTEVGYEQAFMFAYSEREGTAGQRHQTDDVPEDVKQRRLAEIIEAFRARRRRNKPRRWAPRTASWSRVRVKKNPDEWTGKTDTSKWVVFENEPVGTYGGDETKASTNGRRRGAGETGRLRRGPRHRMQHGDALRRVSRKTSLVAFQKHHGAQWTTPRAPAAAAR